MSDVFIAAGAELYIGAAPPATFNKAGFEAVTWQKVGFLSDIPEINESAAEASFEGLDADYVTKLKGIINSGSTNIGYGYVRTDEGQADLDAQFLVRTPSPFKIVCPDTTHLYFMAQVMSKAVNIGTVNNVVMKSNTLAITGPDIGVLEENAPA
jgi:hypothetical protein